MTPSQNTNQASDTSVDNRKPLTARQQEIYDYIEGRIRAWGFPPTIREIGEHLGIRSTNGVADHLKALKRKGYLEQHDMKSRTLRPVRAGGALAAHESRVSYTGTPSQAVPVLGRVAAGTPILAVENAETVLTLDPQLLGQRNDVFALQVVGDSMIDDGILNGDTIFVQRRTHAESGEIVVVVLDNEATVKRYYPEKKRIRLQPANANMQPIYVREGEYDNVQIVGLVVGVFRRVA
jgi:repressor LexA